VGRTRFDSPLIAAWQVNHLTDRSSQLAGAHLIFVRPMKPRIVTALGCLFTGVLFASTLTLAASSQDGPKDAVVLIIRHAEKPDTGPGLSPSGQQRAEAYKDYFKNFTVDSKPLRIDAIFAAKDSKASQRPRLTVEPFAMAANLRIDTHFTINHSAKLAAALRAKQQGKRILISWHHSDIPDLLRALGAKPEGLLSHGGKWPDSVFDWVILLSYDQDGHLIPAGTRRINEHLMPGDSQ
jgi:hypothetical protein